MYTSKWENDTPDSQSGEATFDVKDKKYSVRFESFEDYLNMATLLNIAFSHGKAFGTKEILKKINNMFDDKS